MASDAHELLLRSIEDSGSALCVGLDPDLRALGAWSGGECASRKAVADFLAVSIDAAAPHACSFKIQKAFFDEHPDGHGLLRDAVSRIRAQAPKLPIYLDGKFGDIGNTMRAYLSLSFNDLGVDGVVVNPFMGADVLEAFAAYRHKAALTLVRTSNTAAGHIQELMLADGSPLWRHVLELCVGPWAELTAIIPIVSSTATKDWHQVRALVPSSTAMMVAGFGAQGGNIAELKVLLNRQGGGVCVNTSRRVLFPAGAAWSNRFEAIASAAQDAKHELNLARRS